MKKFGGLFAAEGMLDCFQVEICDSLENPLQKSNPQTSSPPSRSAPINTDSRLLRPSPLANTNVSGPPGFSTQRALMCHRFSTKITLLDVVGFGKQDNSNVI